MVKTQQDANSTINHGKGILRTHDSSIDTLVVNLKILSELREGMKLNCSEKYLRIDASQESHNYNKGWYNEIMFQMNGILRSMRGDSRINTVERLSHMINYSHTLLLTPNMLGPPVTVQCLKDHIRGAIPGVVHLLKTYENDFTAVARLNHIIDRMKILIELD
jgi:hypothetical protein